MTDSPQQQTHSAPACEPLAAGAAVGGTLAAQYDRRWLIVDDAGAWVPPGAAPQLADIAVSLRYGYLTLRAPGMLRIDIPLEVEEDDDSVVRTVRVGETAVAVVDEGDLLAAWVSNVLARPCRLVKRHPPEAAVKWPDR